LRPLVEGREHGQGRVTGTNRVVLEGHRRPEQGHDAVAHDLVHRAVVQMNRIHHELDHRLQDGTRLLGIPTRQQLHRALEVGEQHGDPLALAVQRAG
jgi:hypothetical protein